MAGFHEACFPPRSLAENTTALLALLANPLVDAVSHPGNPVFPVDFEEVVKGAVRYGKALEINNSSFHVRAGSEPNCRTVAALAHEFGALLSCGSDAHYWRDVGSVKIALKVINDEKIHPDQVINSSFERFIAFSQQRKTARLAVG
jgi:putative hydrolase